MQFLTQTNLDPGNCLQTCVACILDVPIDSLPDQLGYGNPFAYVLELREFLRYSVDATLVLVVKHGEVSMHDLAIPEYIMFGQMRGPFGGVCEEHCVVGREGKIVWDPYPTRAGLARVDAVWTFQPRRERWRQQSASLRHWY